MFSMTLQARTLANLALHVLIVSWMDLLKDKTLANLELNVRTPFLDGFLLVRTLVCLATPGGVAAASGNGSCFGGYLVLCLVPYSDRSLSFSLLSRRAGGPLRDGVLGPQPALGSKSRLWRGRPYDDASNPG